MVKVTVTHTKSKRMENMEKVMNLTDAQRHEMSRKTTVARVNAAQYECPECHQVLTVRLDGEHIAQSCPHCVEYVGSIFKQAHGELITGQVDL